MSENASVKISQEALNAIADVAKEREQLLRACKQLRHAPDMLVSMTWDGVSSVELKASVALAALEARHEELRAVLRKYGIEVNGS